MKNRNHPRSARPGFTLVELLVVIAIIAILVGLTAAGVFAYLKKGPELNARNDVSQLAVAVESFKTKFGFYPPSKIFLSNNKADFASDQFRKDSLTYLNKMFPRNAWSGIDWSGGRGMPSGGVILEGDQCLVFFLGGIPTGSGEAAYLGFSTNPTNPTASGGATRIGPFYEGFNGARLTQRVSGNPFYSYLDQWGTLPYAYLSSGLSAGGYGPDCAGLGISPYAQVLGATPRYHNHSSFQVICAGADKAFGPGGVWTASTANTIDPAGRDDITNFHPKAMGVQ